MTQTIALGGIISCSVFHFHEYDLIFRFHELRHTRATLWIALGIEPYMTAILLGHSDLKMLTKIYDHTSEETLRNALLSKNNDPPDSTA